ncbi:MAG: ATP-binding protein [Candidatus Competibacter sp.]|nr:ATP-binding protein [Candidatus Competibacteraceae bacterium]
MIAHGASGSGKSYRTGQLLEIFPGFIHIRSDVERKRLFGLGPLDDSRSTPGGQLYTADASARTYQRLHDLAHGLLAAGRAVRVTLPSCNPLTGNPSARWPAGMARRFSCSTAPPTLPCCGRGSQADENPLKAPDHGDLEPLRAALLAAILV